MIGGVRLAEPCRTFIICFTRDIIQYITPATDLPTMNNHRQHANELSIRGYHQPVELNPLFGRHKDSVGSSLNASLVNWRGRSNKPAEPIKPVKRV